MAGYDSRDETVELNVRCYIGRREAARSLGVPVEAQGLGTREAGSWRELLGGSPGSCTAAVAIVHMILIQHL